eukprot:71383_1
MVTFHSINHQSVSSRSVSIAGFAALSHRLLKHIQNDVLLPHKERLFCKVFGIKWQMNNDFIGMPPQKMMFAALAQKVAMTQVLTLLEYRNNKLALKQAGGDEEKKGVTLYAFEGVIDKYRVDAASNL